LYPPWLLGARPWASSRFTWLLSTIWPIHTIGMPVLRLRPSLAVSQFPNSNRVPGKNILAKSHTGRNLLGGIFPLVTTAMFTNLGYPGASSLLGGIVSYIHCLCHELGSNSEIGHPSHPCPVGTGLLWAQNPCEEQDGQCK